METYFLKTERLGFRKWKAEDIDLALGIWGDFNVTRLVDSRGRLSEEQVRERLMIEIDRDKQYGVQYWPFFLLETGEHLGCGGLRPYDFSKGILETGFYIRTPHWRKGYAVEAARGVVRYAFEDLKVSALFAGHNPENEGSRKVLEKLGFRYIHDEFYPPTGLNHPSYLLKREDYKNA